MATPVTGTGSARPSPITAAQVLAQASALADRSVRLPTFLGMLAGKSAQEQQALLAAWEPCRTLRLDNPMPQYIVRSGDNLNSLARELLTQFYLPSFAAHLTEANAPWLRPGAGVQVNVDQGFINRFGWEAYARSPLFQTRLRQSVGSLVEQHLDTTVALLAATNKLPDTNDLNIDGILQLPTRTTLAQLAGGPSTEELAQLV